MTTLAALPYIEWTETDGSIQRIYADAVTDESGGLPAIVTTFPVEKGAQITDHYRKDPETFKVKMVFSGSPVRGDLDPDNVGDLSQVALRYPPEPPFKPTPGNITGAIAGLFSPSRPDSMNALTFDDPPAARFQTVLDLVRRFQNEGILITIKSTFGRWENMAILSGEPHRDAASGDGAELDLDVTEVRFVSSDVAFGAPLPVEPRALPKKTGAHAGNGEEVDGAKKDSVAKALKDWLSGGGGTKL